jgi:hypothetical protein
MLPRAFGLVALLSLAAASAQAGASGKSFSAADVPPTETEASVEGLTQFLVDFGDDDLRLTLTTARPSWSNTSSIFTTLGGGPLDFGVASLNPPTTLAGLDRSRVLLEGDAGINWAGLSYHAGDFAAIDFGQIPEPAGVALLVTALARLFAKRRAH